MTVQSWVGRLFFLWAAMSVIPQTASASETTPQARQKTALVLSGGGARGLAHIGVLKQLEKMQIPYDCIAGTSMGAIAGGSFATGISTEEAERRVVEANWREVFSDKPDRYDIPYFRKYEDYKPYFDFTLTLDKLKLKAPRNVVGVQNIGLFFRELTGADAESNFDNLPVPYRAVGTDIITGEPVIIRDGTVAEAMRASMTIPGLFPPITYKGHTLVDGGLAKNMPVSVGRELCGPGARVIAVNVSTPGRKIDDLNSFFSIGEQTINISMQRNMQEEVANLTPADVLMTPKLDGYTSADFEKVKDIIRIGEEIVQEHAQALESFRVSDSEYAAWRARIASRKKPEPVIKAVNMADMKWVNPEVMKDLLAVDVGRPFDMAALHKNIDRVYARGDFASISYDLINDGHGNADIMVEPRERDGRDFVRFGLSLYSDFQGDSSFDALVSLRRGWLNRLGAEWRTDIQVGEDSRIYSEWYQPTTLSSAFFLAPYVRYSDVHQDYFLDGVVNFRYQFTQLAGGVELGSVFGRWGEVRVGLVKGHERVQSNTLLVAPDEQFDQAGITVRTIYDQLDNTHFPHEGGSVRLNYFASSDAMGADQSYERLELKAVKATTWSRNTLVGTLRIGSDMNSAMPYYDSFSLGGIFNMSAYPPGYVVGGRMDYGSLVSYRRLSDLPTPLGRGIYGGLLLEAGRAGHVPVELEGMGTALSASAYLAADTALGPAYLLGAIGNNDQSAVYLALGISF